MVACQLKAARALSLATLLVGLLARAVTSNSGGNATDDPRTKTAVYMGAFFAFPNSPLLGALQAVAQTALDHVNSLEGILDDYQLRMRWNWTGAADPEEALRLLYTLVNEGPPVVIASGPHHLSEATIVNQVAARYNIVQMGLATHESLLDRSLYPYTVQAFPSNDAKLLAGAAFFKRMGWRRVAFIFEESIVFQNHMRDFREILEARDIQIVASERVKDIANLHLHLQSLKRQDARIIYLGFYKATTLRLFCQAYLAEMTGAKYVWIAPYWAGTVWWSNVSPSSIAPCSAEQFVDAVDTTFHFTGTVQGDLSVLNYNGVKPLPEHYDYFNSLPVSFIAFTYDNAIATALALNSSIADLQRLQPPRKLEDFTYSDEEMARVILNHAQNIDFIGLQGRVLLEDGQQTWAKVDVAQAQGTEMNAVMIYHTKEELLQNSGVSDIKWKGDHIPVDGVTTRPVILEVSSLFRVILYSLASVGAVIALAFLIINIGFKNKRAIKMSSPPLGNLTVVGCLLLYASVFSTGWDKKDLSDTAIIVKCHLERILISLGLSFAFGSVFMKTYRIHAIFTIAVKKFKRIDLPDWKLIGGVLFAVMVDCVIFLLWIVLDTSTVETYTLEPRLNMTEPEKEIYDVPIIRYCGSEHAQYFTIALYGVKGVLLTFGLFLAWETRNIAVSQLNDSKYIAASVYIVALTIALVVPTMTILGDDVNMTFLVPGVAIVIVNTAVLCLNFIPKVFVLLTVEDKNINLSMMTSMGYGGSSATNSSRLSHKKDGGSRLEGLRSKYEQRKAKLECLCKELQLVCNRTKTN
ncbi:gamma-aminobutyric acid type B receptor subunit 2-like [Patiria miniata]|uniref:G-protein coupled receptors family 3 profile domain-containing protein n=1 Tax=Patiria miniata TaxID=46514 RepID=A0A914AYV8_PATMI|nr:gamma-aminobutyric acid type B receptor subunit 2-like [Patiria miniata]